jgi:hypothetical protein
MLEHIAVLRLLTVSYIVLELVDLLCVQLYILIQLLKPGHGVNICSAYGVSDTPRYRAVDTGVFIRCCCKASFSRVSCSMRAARESYPEGGG